MKTIQNIVALLWMATGAVYFFAKGNPFEAFVAVAIFILFSKLEGVDK